MGRVPGKRRGTGEGPGEPGGSGGSSPAGLRLRAHAPERDGAGGSRGVAFIFIPPCAGGVLNPSLPAPGCRCPCQRESASLRRAPRGCVGSITKSPGAVAPAGAAAGQAGTAGGFFSCEPLPDKTFLGAFLLSSRELELKWKWWLLLGNTFLRAPQRRGEGGCCCMWAQPHTARMFGFSKAFANSW